MKQYMNNMRDMKRVMIPKMIVTRRMMRKNKRVLRMSRKQMVVKTMTMMELMMAMNMKMDKLEITTFHARFFNYQFSVMSPNGR
jgi:hypothetical protein